MGWGGGGGELFEHSSQVDQTGMWDKKQERERESYEEKHPLLLFLLFVFKFKQRFVYIYVRLIDYIQHWRYD